MKNEPLNLVRDNVLRLVDEFVEKLDYLKSYFQHRYKPLTFVYKVEEKHQGRIRIMCKLSGETRKIEVTQYVSISAALQYNFDIIKKYCGEIQNEIENNVIHEGIERMR